MRGVQHEAGIKPCFPKGQPLLQAHSSVGHRSGCHQAADVSHQHRAPAATTTDAKFSFVMGNIRYCQFITLNKS